MSVQLHPPSTKSQSLPCDDEVLWNCGSHLPIPTPESKQVWCGEQARTQHSSTKASKSKSPSRMASAEPSVLLVVVDAVGPECSLKHMETLAMPVQSSITPSLGRVCPHLIPVSPRESLVSDIHEWILCPLLDRRVVRLVLPMFFPQPPGVHAGDEEARDGDPDGEFAPEIW